MKKITLIICALVWCASVAYAATNSTHLSLRKPEITDSVDVETDLNENFDKIDTAIGTQHETTGEHKTITPKVDNTSDLGSSILGFRDAFIKRNLSDGTNTATVANIKDAVDKKHAQNADTKVGVTSNGILKTTNSDGTLAVATAGTDYAVMSSGIVAGLNQHLRFAIMDPASVYGVDSKICIVPKLDAAITITSLEVTCNADPATEIAGDLKYADTFIGLANATVINDFDTTDGVRSDSSIASGSVSAGKAIYISFDSAPVAALKSITFDITYDYD